MADESKSEVQEDIAYAEEYLADTRRVEAHVSASVAARPSSQGGLRRMDGIETNFRLHRSVADAMLSEDPRIGLPTWLVQGFKGGVGALVRNYDGLCSRKLLVWLEQRVLV